MIKKTPKVLVSMAWPENLFDTTLILFQSRCTKAGRRFAMHNNKFYQQTDAESGDCLKELQ